MILFRGILWGYILWHSLESIKISILWIDFVLLIYLICLAMCEIFKAVINLIKREKWRTPSQLHFMKADGLKSSLKEKYQKQKVLKVSNCHILVLSFLFAIGYLGLLQMSDGIRRRGDYAAWWAGPCSLPAAVHRKKCHSRCASRSLYITAVKGWCGLNRMCPSAWACTLTHHLGFSHSHPSPQFFHKQNMKWCVCSGCRCSARQMSLQILMQRVQSPLRIFHLIVHCWHHDGTGKQGPLWLTWQCRR